MFHKIISKIAVELNKSGIPYMVVGGQAVLFYGESRPTKDINITLGIDIDQAGVVKEVIKRLGLTILTANAEEFVKQTMALPAVDPESGIRVDLIFSFSAYEREAIKRARQVPLGEVQVNYTSLEDLFIHKLISGRPLDLEDIRSLLKKNITYDTKYLFTNLLEFENKFHRKYTNQFKTLQKETKSK